MTKNIFSLALALALALLLGLALPAVAADLEVAEGVITTQVVDRSPVDTVESYPANVGKLYCFTRIVGARDDTTVTHVWYHGEDEVARVNLRVASPNWRTWSAKTILPEWVGSWRVEVLDADGQVLGTIPFTLL